MVFFNKSLTVHPLYLTRIFPLAILLCFTACSSKKDDFVSKPVTTAPNERVIPSPNANEPPIIILSPSSSAAASRASAYTPPPASTTKRATVQTVSASSRHVVNNNVAGKGNYAVQIGAFSSSAIANNAAAQAHQKAPSLLSAATTKIDTIPKNGKSLYRVKLTGLSANTAAQACSELKQKQLSCIVTQ